MKHIDCGLLWESEVFLKYAKYGARLEKSSDGTYPDTLVVVVDDETNEAVCYMPPEWFDDATVYTVSLLPNTKVYRPDGKYVLLKDMKHVQEKTLFVPCLTLGGLLCADFFAGALIGYSEKYLSSVTIDADKDAVEIVNFLLQCKGFTHAFNREWSNKTTLYSAELVRKKYFDAFVILSLTGSSDTYEIPILPEGGNLFQDTDAEIIHTVKKFCDKERS